MTTSHSISPHISSTLSSITPSPSPHVFLSGAQSESTPENDLFEKYLLIDTDPETQREREMPAWLVPGLQPLPKRMQDVLENTVTPGATEELHLGQFAGEEGTPVSLQQPPQPKQGTTEALTWDLTLELLQLYDHEVYFDALIAAAHPPPLYADHHADASIVGEGWHPRVAAAFKSLMYDAGIRPEVLMNNVAHIFPDGPVRILVLKMLAQIGSVKCSVPDTVTTPKTRVVQPKTYAQVFHAEFERFMGTPPTAAKAKKYNEASEPMELLFLRDFTEYARTEGFLKEAMQEAEAFTAGQTDLETPPFLYALPFVKQLRPIKLLKLLHSYLIMKKLLPNDSEFEEWVYAKQRAPEKQLGKFTDNNKTLSKSAMVGLPIMIEKYGKSQGWQAKPFRSSELQTFIMKGMMSPMHTVLNLVTLSHTMLYLRRLNANNRPSRLVDLLKSDSPVLSAYHKKDLKAHANAIASASVAIMCERYHRGYTLLAMEKLQKVLGGQHSKYLYVADRLKIGSLRVSTQPDKDDAEQGPSSSKVPKVE